MTWRGCFLGTLSNTLALIWRSKKDSLMMLPRVAALKYCTHVNRKISIEVETRLLLKCQTPNEIQIFE